jgi:hypothetical protein
VESGIVGGKDEGIGDEEGNGPEEGTKKKRKRDVLPGRQNLDVPMDIWSIGYTSERVMRSQRRGRR